MSKMDAPHMSHFKYTYMYYSIGRPWTMIYYTPDNHLHKKVYSQYSALPISRGHFSQ